MPQLPTKPETNPPLQPHEIELERKRALLAKVHTTRDSMLQNMVKLEGTNPAKQYSWINNSEPRINFFAAQGYIICKDPAVKSRFQREDGTHVRGDLILMERDRELHEAWKYDGEMRAVADMEGSRDSFKAFAARNGVPVEQPR